MAHWLRRLAILCIVAGCVGGVVALMSVWMAPDQYCAWKECMYNGWGPPPPPPRTATIGLVFGPTLPFGVYWMLFVAILALVAGSVFWSRLRPRLLLICSVVALGALALLFLDTRLPTIVWWGNGACGSDCYTPGQVRYTMPSEWLFLWCFAPCCLAIGAQYFSTRLRIRASNNTASPGSPSPVGEGAGG